MKYLKYFEGIFDNIKHNNSETFINLSNEEYSNIITTNKKFINSLDSDAMYIDKKSDGFVIFYYVHRFSHTHNTPPSERTAEIEIRHNIINNLASYTIKVDSTEIDNSINDAFIFAYQIDDIVDLLIDKVNAVNSYFDTN